MPGRNDWTSGFVDHAHTVGRDMPSLEVPNESSCQRATQGQPLLSIRIWHLNASWQ
jgi:hypothetical protein